MNEIQMYETGEIINTTSTVAEISKSEVEAQLDAAHKYPRRISYFMEEAKTMVSRSQEIAESCFFSMPRGGKNIMGPSVRLAEIAASAYGNLQVAARPIDVGPEDREVTSQGVAWDMQKNVRYMVESKRRIVDKYGKRYKEDMIVMTQNAASSIALRNAIFRVIPRAYIDDLYNHARHVAVGDVRAIRERRRTVVTRLIKMGTTEERILAVVGRDDVEQITAEDLEKLIGMGTAIKDGHANIDEQFPPVQTDEEPPNTLDAVSAQNKKKTANTESPARTETLAAAQELWGDGANARLSQALRRRNRSITDATDTDFAAVLDEINEALEERKGMGE